MQAKRRPRKWTATATELLKKWYPTKGKRVMALMLCRTEACIRQRASELGLRLDQSSEHWKDFQRRAPASKVGKKRPDQAVVMKRLHAEGKLSVMTPERRAKMSKNTKERLARQGHPRGALGMKHTPETLAKISAASTLTAAMRTPEQVDAMMRKGLATKIANGTYAKPRVGTWKAAWREIGGQRKYFRSRWEANYARWLQWRKERGEITAWEHEAETFWFDAIKRGCRTYLPDFRVTELNGSFTYHEVKGWMDPKSVTKLKRMKKYHPHIVMILVDGPKYKQLTKNAGLIIPGWEE